MTLPAPVFPLWLISFAEIRREILRQGGRYRDYLQQLPSEKHAGLAATLRKVWFRLIAGTSHDTFDRVTAIAGGTAHDQIAILSADAAACAGWSAMAASLVAPVAAAIPAAAAGNPASS